MRPAGLDDRPEFLLPRHERGVETFERGQQLLLDGDRGRQLERRRDRVVRALAAVDVVVGVDLPASQAGARQVEGSKVGLAHVIGLCSACTINILQK